jgi:hypothetical protein
MWMFIKAAICDYLQSLKEVVSTPWVWAIVIPVAVILTYLDHIGIINL